MIGGSVLGSLGIGYLLLEVGHLGLCRIDVLLGFLGGLLGAWTAALASVHACLVVSILPNASLRPDLAAS